MARAAKALEVLRKQLNELYPNRSKVSDGGEGDAAHKGRVSDHNPNSAGVFRARDFTHNDAPEGVNGHWLLQTLLKHKDKRIKYIIFFRQIYNVKHHFAPKPYNGTNAHKHHLHLSVSDNPALYDDETAWNLSLLSELKSSPGDLPVMDAKGAVDIPITNKRRELQRGAKGAEVATLQMALVHHGFFAESQVDSDFGMKTEQALQRFQLSKGLTADGIAGAKTFAALGI